MRILTFSRDPRLLETEEDGNESLYRQRRYAELLGQERCFVVMGREAARAGRGRPGDPVRSVSAGSGMAARRLGNAIRLGLELARRVDFDAIEYQDPEFTGWAAWRVARRLGRPLGGGVFNDRIGHRRWIGRSPRRIAIDLGARFLLRRTRVVRTDAATMAARLAKFGSARVIHVPFFIPHLERFRISASGIDRRLALWDEDPLALCVARLEAEKGHETLLEAFARAVAATGRGRLMIVGGGSKEKSLRRLAARLVPADRIDWAGEIAYDRLPELYHRAQIFLHASYSDTAPRTLVLAQAARLPIVATGVAGSDAIVAEGEDGFLVPPDAPALLGDRLARLLADRALFATMIQRGPFAAPARHGEESITGPLRAFYAMLMENAE